MERRTYSVDISDVYVQLDVECVGEWETGGKRWGKKGPVPKSQRSTASVQSVYFCICYRIAWISNSAHDKSTNPIPNIDLILKPVHVSYKTSQTM